MKIIFFARRFYPEIGGVEKHVREISNRLQKKGHHVTIITEAVDKYPARDLVDGIEVRRIFVGRENKFKKFRIWKNLFAYNKIIKEADVIHCHDVFFWYLPFRLLYPHKPVYTTFHGYESYPITKQAIRIRKLSEKLSWGNICIGNFIKKWYGTTPTYISYGGVEIPRKTNNIVKKESAIFVGRLDKQTGIRTYIQTFELLKKKYPKFTLLLVGDGDQKEFIPASVRITGFQDYPEKYLKKYHFVFVSGYLSILEAFAAKKIVIATFDNPLKKDYLKMTPYAKNIIIDDTPEKIVKKIEAVLQNPKKEQEMLAVNYDWAKKQSWEKLVDTYLTLWKHGRSMPV